MQEVFIVFLHTIDDDDDKKRRRKSMYEPEERREDPERENTAGDVDDMIFCEEDYRVSQR